MMAIAFCIGLKITLTLWLAGRSSLARACVRFLRSSAKNFGALRIDRTKVGEIGKPDPPPGRACPISLPGISLYQFLVPTKSITWRASARSTDFENATVPNFNNFPFEVRMNWKTITIASLARECTSTTRSSLGNSGYCLRNKTLLSESRDRSNIAAQLKLSLGPRTRAPWPALLHSNLAFFPFSSLL
jgi:hypothetical protein